MKLLQYIVLGAASMGLAACSSTPDEPEITNQQLTGYYNIISNLDTGDITVATGISYDVTYNYTDKTMTMKMSGLQLPDGTSYPTLTIGPLAWTADGQWKLSQAATVQTSGSNYFSAPQLTNFSFQLADRYMDENTYTATTFMRFTVNGYSVVSLPKTQTVWGNTTVTHSPTGYVVDNDNMVYVVEVNPETQLASLTVNNFSLTDEMNINAVTIRDIPYVTHALNGVELKTPRAVATVVGASDPDATRMVVTDLDFSISGLTWTASFTVNQDGNIYSVRGSGN